MFILKLGPSVIISTNTRVLRLSVDVFHLLGSLSAAVCHDDVMKWKHFPRYWPFVRGIHRSPVNSPHKASDAELWCFLWSTLDQTVLSVMMTSWNGNIFRVTGPLCGEFTGHRWIPLTKPVTRSFDVFFDLRLTKRLSKQWRRRFGLHHAHYDVTVMVV